MITSMYVAYQTSNVAAVIEVRSASFGLVFHAQYIFTNVINFLVTGYNRLQFSIFHILCIRYDTRGVRVDHFSYPTRTRSR